MSAFWYLLGMAVGIVLSLLIRVHRPPVRVEGVLMEKCECWACGFVFVAIHRDAEVVVCPQCGHRNAAPNQIRLFSRRRV